MHVDALRLENTLAVTLAVMSFGFIAAILLRLV
jgi:hypothetical protein